MNTLKNTKMTTDARKTRIYLLTCLLAIGVCLSACAGLQQKTSEERLLSRARSYWAAVAAGDYVSAYQYEEVSKTGAQPISAYVRKAGLIYKSAEVTGAKIEGDRATVDVKIGYIIPAMGSHVFNTDAKDVWLIIDGDWYHHAEGIMKDLKRIESGEKR
ncbi:hypothetical protein [Dissulfurimicrobium hydrothermale]|uniref:hypothetical protein n=1 Tax=Dissulfurimicrobium hydrothermale TaxID=1750598 RepID=UPI001EDB156D|nr:hypothetical protein [Dissulfurimicrobium hydrothermale]UKL13776.1 hypothetical protein LGS26_00380 [Dissulfurimicrobium hydrothermale]